MIYLIYADNKRSIITYNLNDEKKINEIKNAHSAFITNFRHFFDKNNKRDLIITIAGYENNIKLWNFNNFECLIDITEINNDGRINSACFFKNDNNIYIVTSNCNNKGLSFAEPIKLYEFEGNKIKEINDSHELTYFIDIYEDNKNNKSYIITGNEGYSKSYDYNNNTVYHKYEYEIWKNHCHMSIIIDKSEDTTKMIESSCIGNIVVWDFHSGKLIKIININKGWLYSIGFFEKNILFVG